MKQKPFTKYSVLVLLLMLYSLTSCTSFKSPKPIPVNKSDFIGMWVSPTGFIMDIKPSGTADVTENTNSSNPDDVKLNIGITPKYSKDMLVEFRGDTILVISQPTVRAREYHIDKNPYQVGDTCKMILNGVLLIRQK
jgi:hypothetical protein